MAESVAAKSKGPRRAAAAAIAAAATLLAALAAGPGCGPAEVGTIDMAKSKAIAAEKGIGPGGGGPSPDAGKARKAASARPSQAGVAPGAPAPK
ncbi:hypothetical protein OJF2_41570 [Aquisphaera giovannonii]|uniref:Uncharacterized protein n=1 Tax=Aquisphaera giovannonii TaxID=406548 RepID=A0A5B9W5X0_9BACT|nr:hypothetical protein [Aquisphaera giovannonii]QEH35604.1 hypothetical protein OJF2_41570 [Aquisphaera giovannonii]